LQIPEFRPDRVLDIGFSVRTIGGGSVVIARGVIRGRWPPGGLGPKGHWGFRFPAVRAHRRLTLGRIASAAGRDKLAKTCCRAAGPLGGTGVVIIGMLRRRALGSRLERPTCTGDLPPWCTRGGRRIAGTVRSGSVAPGKREPCGLRLAEYEPGCVSCGGRTIGDVGQYNLAAEAPLRPHHAA